MTMEEKESIQKTSDHNNQINFCSQITTPNAKSPRTNNSQEEDSRIVTPLDHQSIIEPSCLTIQNDQDLPTELITFDQQMISRPTTTESCQNKIVLNNKNFTTGNSIAKFQTEII